MAWQSCSRLGRQADCQALASLTLAGAKLPVPPGASAVSDERWTADREPCAAASVPEAEVVARSNGAIALAELNRLVAAQVRLGSVVADAGSGASMVFHVGLTECVFAWGSGIPRNQKLYDADIWLVPP